MSPGNLAKAREARADARAPGRAPRCLLTELFISGYPPEDLVLKPAFLRACLESRGTTSRPIPPTAGRASIVGFPRQR